MLHRFMLLRGFARGPRVLTDGHGWGLFGTFDSRLRLQTTVRLRWFAVVGQLIAVLVVHFGLGFPLPLGYCLLFIAGSAWVNVILRVSYPARHRLSPAFATLLLAYDTVQLAILLYLTGGIENPFTVLMVAPVTVSAATLPPRNTILLGALALIAMGVLVASTMPLPWDPGQRLDLPLLYKVGLFAAVASCLTFLALYAWRLSKEARQMSAALSATELVLAREQKLHALDGLAAAAAHELGTPLSTIVLVAKELEQQVPPGSAAAEDLVLLRSQAQRCREILQKLTRHPSEQDPDPLHANLSITQLLDEAAAPHREGDVAITINARPEPGSPEPVGERRPGLIYGLGNLIENAVEFATARVQITALWNEREVTVAVSDDGPGFAPEVLDAIGDPYVTTRPVRGAGKADSQEPTGLGLGFFIAKTLLERSGATLSLGNRRGDEHGAIVRISWPRAAFETRIGRHAPQTANQTPAEA